MGDHMDYTSSSTGRADYTHHHAHQSMVSVYLPPHTCPAEHLVNVASLKHARQQIQHEMWAWERNEHRGEGSRGTRDR